MSQISALGDPISDQKPTPFRDAGRRSEAGLPALYGPHQIAPGASSPALARGVSEP